MVIAQPSEADLMSKTATGNKIWRTTQNSVFNDDLLKISSPKKDSKKNPFFENYGRKVVDMQQLQKPS